MNNPAEINKETTDSDELLKPILDTLDSVEQNLDDAQIAATLAEIIEGTCRGSTVVVSLVGGAASGKSTLSCKISEELAKSGTRTDTIGTDDFNRGNRTWRWEKFEGKLEANPLEKYDFALLNAKIQQIKDNKDPKITVAVPTYNQETGLAIDEGEKNYTHQVGIVDVLIVEGDFHAVEDPDIVIYLHVPDTQRLQNRLGRDAAHRGGEVQKTTTSFNFRHIAQHLPHTLPTAAKANYIITVDAKEGQRRYNLHQAKAPLQQI